MRFMGELMAPLEELSLDLFGAVSRGNMSELPASL